MKFEFASFSEIGPRAKNEDSIGSWRLADGALAVVVADGLGGMSGGAQASSIAVSMFGSAISSPKVNPTTFNFRAFLQQVHTKIRAAQEADSLVREMATTFTAAVFCGSSIRGIHCGDSRAVIARANGIQRLTTDHSEAQRLFDAGKLTKSEYLHYPRKNVIYSALGAATDPIFDEFQFNLLAGDKVFFSTDGTHEKILLRELQQISFHHTTPEQISDEVLKFVVSRRPTDNFSFVAVSVEQ